MSTPFPVPNTGWLALSTGGYLDLINPQVDQIHIADIAVGLGNACRFAGQGVFYSVAEHSIYASEFVENGFQFEALLHDATEAYLGDIPTPLKGLLPDYKIIERRLDTVIREKYGLPPEISPAVKKIDLDLLALEKVRVCKNTDDWAGLEKSDPPDFSLSFYSPHRAMMAFLSRFNQLDGARP